jgi:hypothetical protein
MGSVNSRCVNVTHGLDAVRRFVATRPSSDERTPASRAVKLLAASLAILWVGCGSGEPFAQVPVSGKVTYEDGTPIPVDGVTLNFISQTPPRDAKTHPRTGLATVDKTSGAFSAATTHKANDGLVRGKHKVTITSPGGPLPPSVVPIEYRDPAKTPLEVDTTDQPFVLKVRKPR